MAEERMLADDAVKGIHQAAKPLLPHRGDAVVPVQPLAIERVRSLLDRVDLQSSIEPGGLAGSAEQRQERVRQGDPQQEPIVPGRIADVRRRQPHAEVEVLGVAEGLLDLPSVNSRKRRRLRLPVLPPLLLLHHPPWSRLSSRLLA